MACQRCEAGVKRVIEEGRAVHYVGNEGRGVDRFFCDDQPTRISDTPPMTDAERTQLYLMIEIASDVRMKHDVRLFDSLDWSRELFAEGFQGTKEKAIEIILLCHHHVCTPACLAPKVIE